MECCLCTLFVQTMSGLCGDVGRQKGCLAEGMDLLCAAHSSSSVAVQTHGTAAGSLHALRPCLIVVREIAHLPVLTHGKQMLDMSSSNPLGASMAVHHLKGAQRHFEATSGFQGACF